TLFANKTDIPHQVAMVDYDTIKASDYNLAVSSYVEAKDTREVIDIDVLNDEIKSTVTKIDTLRRQIDEIVGQIEGA
ncbi:N-6 DNA methylase, partial [Moraxella sp. HMSC061H09]|uniref:N-6 DNA methylase n=3 Tax=Moraxella TaxID=475 RepID=UPI0011D101C9